MRQYTKNIWMRQYTNSGKFGVVENLSENEKELRILVQHNQNGVCVRARIRRSGRIQTVLVRLCQLVQQC